MVMISENSGFGKWSYQIVAEFLTFLDPVITYHQASSRSGCRISLTHISFDALLVQKMSVSYWEQSDMLIRLITTVGAKKSEHGAILKRHTFQ